MLWILHRPRNPGFCFDSPVNTNKGSGFIPMVSFRGAKEDFVHPQKTRRSKAGVDLGRALASLETATPPTKAQTIRSASCYSRPSSRRAQNRLSLASIGVSVLVVRVPPVSKHNTVVVCLVLH